MLFVSQDDYVGDGYYSISDKGHELLLESRIKIDTRNGQLIIEGYWKQYSQPFGAVKRMFNAKITSADSMYVDKVKIKFGKKCYAGSIYTRGKISCGSFKNSVMSDFASVNINELPSGLNISGIIEGKETIYFYLNFHLHEPRSVLSNVVHLDKQA